MVRFACTEGDITIIYGRDQAAGVFLQVKDYRLETQRTASPGVTVITEKIGADGNGEYFHLHSGKFGRGFKVTEETIAEFLARFEVPDEHFQAIGLTKPKENMSIKV